MQCVVVKFHLHPCAAVKDALVHRSNLGPAAIDATQGIAHRGVGRVVPVLLHESQVAIVEGAVELGQSFDRSMPKQLKSKSTGVLESPSETPKILAARLVHTKDLRRQLRGGYRPRL